MLWRNEVGYTQIHSLHRNARIKAFMDAGALLGRPPDGRSFRSRRPLDMKPRASRNRTLTCSGEEIEALAHELLVLSEPTALEHIVNRIICGDTFRVLPFLPVECADLLILDPPYNLTRNYNGHSFRRRKKSDYAAWFEELVTLLIPTLKPDASVYVCADWKTSLLIAPVLERHLCIRNRITWERDKGRGAKSNWKNNSEDIWFCTLGRSYFFHAEAVKLKRKVIAPYRVDGKPKDWMEEDGGHFRLTHASNLWSDISVPFWSMSENTDHPTQKPEKLIAKLILASSKRHDLVLDPFLGSGTTAVVAHKLGRSFCGVELDREYCCWSQKRLHQASADASIQGYTGGVFWERNSQNNSGQLKSGASEQGKLPL